MPTGMHKSKASPTLQQITLDKERLKNLHLYTRPLPDAPEDLRNFADKVKPKTMLKLKGLREGVPTILYASVTNNGSHLRRMAKVNENGLPIIERREKRRKTEPKKTPAPTPLPLADPALLSSGIDLNPFGEGTSNGKMQLVTVSNHLDPLDEEAIYRVLDIDDGRIVEEQEKAKKARLWNPSSQARKGHVEAERERRRRVQAACNEFRKLVPGIFRKTDKAAVLEHTVYYVVHLMKHCPAFKDHHNCQDWVPRPKPPSLVRSKIEKEKKPPGKRGRKPKPKQAPAPPMTDQERREMHETVWSVLYPTYGGNIHAEDKEKSPQKGIAAAIEDAADNYTYPPSLLEDLIEGYENDQSSESDSPTRNQPSDLDKLIAHLEPAHNKNPEDSPVAAIGYLETIEELWNEL